MLLLFLWGKLNREKRLGYAADYCPVCRQARAYEVSEVRNAAHF